MTGRLATALGPIVIDGRYLTDHYPGIGRYVYNLVMALTEAEPDASISLLIDSTGRQTRFDLDTLERRGVAIVPVAASPRSVRGRIGVGRLCRQLSPSLFHATHMLSPLPRSCATLLTVYDVIPMHDAGTLPSIRDRFAYRLLLRRALGSATRVVTLSETSRDDLERLCGVAPARVTVTPAAADPSFRPAAPNQVAAVRARMQLPEQYVLYVGTNRPHKNLPRLVEAWARIEGGRRDGCHLVIAGPEDDRYPEARQQAGALNLKTVIFTGAIAEADLPVVYSGARLVVQPSLCEGFGLPVLEAMACGAPVACARIPALVEVSGDAAIHFDPANVVEMAAALGRGLDDEVLRTELMSRGRARAGRFSWAQTAAHTLAVYRELGAAGAAGRRPS